MEHLIPFGSLIKILKEKPVSKGLVPVKINEQIILRLFYSFKEHVLLIPENSKYIPSLFNKVDFEILGVVKSYQVKFE